MNVIISNQQDEIIKKVNIEVIKQIQGEYNVDDIINSFSTFFYNKMIIDVTALNNYTDINIYQRLSIGLSVDKIILLLPAGTLVSSQDFLSKLISMGYYNFTTNAEGLEYLIEHPNSYKDVAYIHRIDGTSKNDLDNTKEKMIVQDKKMILGIKNVTDSAGATTLTYLIYKELTEKYKANCIAIEVGKADFGYFGDQNLVSILKNELTNTLVKYESYDIILVDLNDANSDECGDCIYLIEPSIIKINKLMRRDRIIFQKIKDRKVVLNKCLLSESDIKTFESETKTKVFAVVKPLDDRAEQVDLDGLLEKLGLIASKNMDN